MIDPRRRLRRLAWLLLGVAAVHAEDRSFRIGYWQAPPNQMVDEAGKPYGLAVDIVTEAARRADVRLQWVLTPEGPDVVLLRGDVDLFPLLTETPERQGAIYFSAPWRFTMFSMIWRESSGLSGPSGFGGRRLALVRERWAIYEASREFRQAELVYMPSQQDVLKAVCQGRAEAGLLYANPTTNDGFTTEPLCRPVTLRAQRLDESGARLGLAARRADSAATSAADRIRAAIDTMWFDGTMAGAYLKWVASATYERESMERLRQAEAVNLELRVIAAIALCLALVLAYVAFRLRRAIRAKSEFLAAMSHEIRTPMNGMLGMAELFETIEEEPGKRAMVATMRESGESLLAILNEILDTAKLESGRMDFAERPFDLWLVAEETVTVFWATGWSRGIDVRVEIDAKTPRIVLGDPLRLRQILMNLTANALRHTERGHVALQLRPSPGSVTLAVADTGAGIPGAMLERIFEPFRQGKRGQADGTGLGLSISRRLAEGMGGTLEVESEVGRGSTFRLTLPFVGKPGDAAGAPPALLVPDGEEAAAHARAVLDGAGVAWQELAGRWDGTGFALWTGAAPPPASPGGRVFLVAAVGRLRGVGLPMLPMPLRPSRLFREEEGGAEGRPEREAVGNAGRVLVVDDNQVNRRVVCGMLRRAGYTVVEAAGGAEAVELARDGFPVILMDCLMPEMDGWQATEAIRANEGDGRHALIVAVTANAFAEDRARCRAAGMDEFLAKPIRSSELLRIVERGVAAG